MQNASSDAQQQGNIEPDGAAAAAAAAAAADSLTDLASSGEANGAANGPGRQNAKDADDAGQTDGDHAPGLARQSGETGPFNGIASGSAQSQPPQANPSHTKNAGKRKKQAPAGRKNPVGQHIGSAPGTDTASTPSNAEPSQSTPPDALGLPASNSVADRSIAGHDKQQPQPKNGPLVEKGTIAAQPQQIDNAGTPVNKPRSRKRAPVKDVHKHDPAAEAAAAVAASKKSKPAKKSAGSTNKQAGKPSAPGVAGHNNPALLAASEGAQQETLALSQASQPDSRDGMSQHRPSAAHQAAAGTAAPVTGVQASSPNPADQRDSAHATSHAMAAGSALERRNAEMKAGKPLNGVTSALQPVAESLTTLQPECAQLTDEKIVPIGPSASLASQNGPSALPHNLTSAGAAPATSIPPAAPPVDIITRAILLHQNHSRNLSTKDECIGVGRDQSQPEDERCLVHA